MCVFLRWQLGLVYTPEAWHYPHHFWLTLVLRRRERDGTRASQKTLRKGAPRQAKCVVGKYPSRNSPANIYGPDLSFSLARRVADPSVGRGRSLCSRMALGSWWPGARRTALSLIVVFYALLRRSRLTRKGSPGYAVLGASDGVTLSRITIGRTYFADFTRRRGRGIYTVLSSVVTS